MPVLTTDATVAGPAGASPPRGSVDGPAVRLESVSVRYGLADRAVTALRGVDLTVPAGEHLAILGASGSGKTTLLGCLSGRISPIAGRVHCSGRVATIHQDLRLVAQRSALANVLHGCLGRQSAWRTLIRFPADERRRAADLLERVGLGHRLHSRVGRLSGGEQQRVAIARALMQDPSVILADEPVASLDARSAADIMRLLRDLGRERKITIVSVLHDCSLAESFADRIVGLHQGRIVYDSRLTPQTSFSECLACRRIADHAAAPVRRDDSDPLQQRRDRRRLHRRRAMLAAAIVLGAGAYAWSLVALDVGPRQLEGVVQGAGRFLADLAPTRWAQVAAIPWAPILLSLVETLQMALLGTTLGMVISWPMAALAADNVGPRGLRRAMRFVLNVIRTIPSLVWALFCLAAVGFGNLAGVLALTAYSVGYLTKFFYEAFEAVPPQSPDALGEIGAGGLQRFVHSVWPAATPAILSSSLFMLEYNVRAASVLGIVDAGGIGFYFKQFYDFRNFPAMLACLVLLLIVVVILDAISTRLRAALVRA